MSPGRTGRMSDVARLSSVSLSHLSRIAAGLEARGWVRRLPDPDGRRATLPRLTDEGWEKVVATAPGHAEEVQRLVLDTLDPAQVAQLRAIGEQGMSAVRPGVHLPPGSGGTC